MMMKAKELTAEEIKQTEKSFRMFCEWTIAMDNTGRLVDLQVKVPERIKWLAETKATYLRGVTLDDLILDALTDYLTKED